MNLYLVSQEENQTYQTYDSFVVVAAGKESARYTYPYDPTYESPNTYIWDKDKQNWYSLYSDGTRSYEDTKHGPWTTRISKIKVELIGKAEPHLKEGLIVCSSFNAG